MAQLRKDDDGSDGEYSDTAHVHNPDSEQETTRFNALTHVSHF